MINIYLFTELFSYYLLNSRVFLISSSNDSTAYYLFIYNERSK